MEISIPDALDFWFSSEVVVSRSYKNSLLITRLENLEAMVEKSTENLLRATEEASTREQAREMILIAIRPTKRHITASGGLSLPANLAEWLVPESEGRLRFRGGDEEIHIDWSSCLCDDPTCAKCLGGNCKDPDCFVHRQVRKSAFAHQNKPHYPIVPSPK